jgi:hypothetical protein
VGLHRRDPVSIRAVEARLLSPLWNERSHPLNIMQQPHWGLCPFLETFSLLSKPLGSRFDLSRPAVRDLAIGLWRISTMTSDSA